MAKRWKGGGGEGILWAPCLPLVSSGGKASFVRIEAEVVFDI